MERTIIPHVIKPQQVGSLPPSASVRDAVTMMVERRCGAVAIVDEGELVGIFTERDLLTRVVGMDRAPSSTPLKEVMTAKPDTLAPTADAREALTLMQERRYRHLPIVENGKVLAILSIRDLHEAVLGELESDVKQRDELMFGPSSYGLA